MKADPRPELLISRPYVGRVSGRWVVVLARPILAADGRFLGALIASLELESLQKSLSSVQLGAHGAFSLRDADMGVILRFPEPKGIGANIGSRNISSQLAQMLERKMTSGAYRAVTPLDGIERTVSFTRSSAYPLFVNVGLSSQDYLAQWRQERNMALWAFAMLLALSCFAGWLLWGMYRLQSDEIALRKRAEKSMKLATNVFATTQEGILVTDAERRIVDVNQAFSDTTGFSREEVLGKSPSILSSARQSPEFYAGMWHSIKTTGGWRGEIWNRRKSGEEYPELLSISTVRDTDGSVEHYVGVFSDISQLKSHEHELERIANYDPLTGLPNRRLLSDRLLQAVSRAQRGSRLMAVCYLDLDGFKPINDQAGHAAGDAILVEVADRLRATLRGDDTIARLGGDEFVLLLNEVTNHDECAQTMTRLLEMIARQIDVDGICFSVTASVGVALYPEDDTDPDTLLRHADQAMYMAKDAGRNRCHFFDPEHDRLMRTRRESAQDVAKALERGEFVLHYQPKVHLRTGEIIGMEALIRWQHAERGLLPPGEFLPWIEGTDLDVPLGDWVLEAALQQIERWVDAGIPLAVSVNVSAKQLQRPNFAAHLRQILERHPKVPRGGLCLEVLESAAIGDLEHAALTLEACQALGVPVAMDDFGTGYSSLTYFRKLPVSQVKIDRSFVIDMLADRNDRQIVESIVRLAEAFEYEVIAEGVETGAHCAMLLDLGCSLAQGFGIAHPMPAEVVADWAREWRQSRRHLSITGQS